MTDLANTDVTYSFKSNDKHFIGKSGFIAYGTLTFGDGSLTFPSGGLQLDKEKMGLPVLVRSVQILNQEKTDAIKFGFDSANCKLTAFAVSGITGTLSANSAGTPTGNVNAVTGNVSAPLISLANAEGNVAADLVIGVNAVADGSVLVGSDAMANVAGIQAPTFTGDAPGFVGDALAAHSHTFSSGTGSMAAYTSAPSAGVILTVEVLGY
jgi:hypothetical protein